MSCTGPLEQKVRAQSLAHFIFCADVTTVTALPNLLNMLYVTICTYRSGHGCGTTNRFAKFHCLEHTPSSTPNRRAGAGGSQHPQGSSSSSLDGQNVGRSLYKVGGCILAALDLRVGGKITGHKVSLAFSWALYFLHFMDTGTGAVKWSVKWCAKKALSVGTFVK